MVEFASCKGDRQLCNDLLAMFERFSESSALNACDVNNVQRSFLFLGWGSHVRDAGLGDVSSACRMTLFQSYTLNLVLCEDVTFHGSQDIEEHGAPLRNNLRVVVCFEGSAGLVMVSLRSVRPPRCPCRCRCLLVSRRLKHSQAVSLDMSAGLPLDISHNCPFITAIDCT